MCRGIPVYTGLNWFVPAQTKEAHNKQEEEEEEEEEAIGHKSDPPDDEQAPVCKRPSLEPF